MGSDGGLTYPPRDMLIGAMTCSWFSFLGIGFVTASGYEYYTRFPRDPLWLKLVVGALILNCAIETVASGAWAFDWTVTNYGDSTILNDLRTPYRIISTEIGVVPFIAQPFYAWRLWMITQKKNWWLPLFICSMSAAQMAITIWAQTVYDKFSGLAKLFPIAYVWLFSSVLADLTITVGIIWYLGIRTGEAPLSRLSFRAIISRTVQANVLSLFSQIVLAIIPQITVGFYLLTINQVVIHVYAFSVLASLNARNTTFTMFDTNGQITSVRLSSLSRWFRDTMRNTKGTRSTHGTILTTSLGNEQSIEIRLPQDANESQRTQSSRTETVKK